MGITSVLPVVLTDPQQRARRVARTSSSVPVLPAGIISLLSPRHQVFCAVAITEDGCFSADLVSLLPTEESVGYGAVFFFFFVLSHPFLVFFHNTL